MTKGQQFEKKSSSEQLENARLGYQAAISMWNYYGEGLWAKYNALLVANSIVIAAIGLVYASQDPLPVLACALPILGLMLSAVWFLITRRGTEQHVFFGLAARELEERFLSNEVNLLSRGTSYAAGDPVSLEVGGASRPLRMSVWARAVRTSILTCVVIAIFAAMYLAVIIQNIL